MLDPYEELKSVLRRLDEAKIDYALCGELPPALHSISRATLEIELLIIKDALASGLKALAEIGYTVREKTRNFAEGVIVIDRVSKTDPDGADTLSIDLISVTDALREIWDSRERLQWEAGEISVVSGEGLIALKRLHDFRNSSAAASPDDFDGHTDFQHLTPEQRLEWLAGAVRFALKNRRGD